jgi:CelD/BcsL family acetyltransferase involved in cellulose biosynthesis/GNAT superfamily N-acetyltransferase
MRIEILKGSDARKALTDNAFLEAWRSLHFRCSWATVCQGVDFCTAWYETYEDSFEPLLVTGTEAAGNLIGLLTLGVNVTSGEIVTAGANQAEYQVWISTSEARNIFIETALHALRDDLTAQTLKFMLPPGTPLDWMSARREWSGRCALKRIPRALMDVGDGSRLRDSLRKKNNKSKLNRLERAGKLQLKQLTDPQELEAVFDEVMTLDTFRLGAIHHLRLSPQQSTLKKAFYVRMMQAPRLLHVTLLLAGEYLVSAHIGHYNKDHVMLGILAHSPFFAKHSPSKLHVLLLGQHLAGEGITTFDLTPEGEYKERFATHHDDAYNLMVFFNRARYLLHKVGPIGQVAAKEFLSVAGSNPAQFRSAIERVQHKFTHLKVSSLPIKIFRLLKRNLWYTSEMRVYSMDAEAAMAVPQQQSAKRDCLSDLMKYEVAEAWQPTAQSFLKQALKNLEAGMHSYTYAENGRLLHYGWLIERQEESSLTEVGQRLYLPPNSAVLADFYTHPEARGQGLYSASLSQMLHAAANVADTRSIFICVMADNHASRRVIERLGFLYQYSFFRKKALGRTEKWSNAPTSATGGTENAAS